MSKPTIYYSSIAWRALEVPHVNSMLRLMQHPRMDGGKHFTQANDAMVDRARGQVASRFLRDSDCDVLLSVDSDIEFQAEDAITICDQAHELGIVAGIYVTRDRNRAPVPSSCLGLNEPIILGGSDATPVPILWPAGGFLAVARRVFTAVREHAELPLMNPKQPWYSFWPFYTPFWTEYEDQGMVYLSEDWAFGERARRAGFPSYANPAVRLKHHGTYAFQHSDMLRAPLPGDPIAAVRTGAGSFKVKLLETAPPAGMP